MENVQRWVGNILLLAEKHWMFSILRSLLSLSEQKCLDSEYWASSQNFKRKAETTCIVWGTREQPLCRPFWLQVLKAQYRFTLEPFGALCPADLGSALPQYLHYLLGTGSDGVKRNLWNLHPMDSYTRKTVLNAYQLGSFGCRNKPGRGEEKPGLLPLLSRASSG